MLNLSQRLDDPMTAPNLGMTNQVCVLLIDDDKEHVSEMVDLLKSYQYKVKTVDTASEGMSILSKGMERIDVMIINMNSPNLLSFHLLDQALDLDIVSFCVCDKYDASLAKKAFQNGAHLYLEKPLHQGIVKYLWQFVLRKQIQKEKAIGGLEENGDHHKHVDNIDSNNFVGGDKEQGIEKNNVPINIDEQSNNIHETANIALNEKCKLSRKRGRKPIKEAMNAAKVVAGKSRIEWTADLHAKFMEAVNQLDEGRCFPSVIHKIMNVPDITWLQVANHLQKCRNNTSIAPQERKSTHHPSSQVGSSSASIQRSSLENFGTASHLQQPPEEQYSQETQIGPKIPFLSNNTIFARRESSPLQQVYHPQVQVDPRYLNPFNTPSLPAPENDNVVWLQPQQEPLSALLGSQGSNFGSTYNTTGLEFNNGIHHSQNNYALDAATYSTMPDTNTENETTNELGVANIDFQQYIGEPNMSQPNNIVTTSHVSDTQGGETNGRMSYFDFTDMDYLFENCEPPSSNLPNEHGIEFDQIYSDGMAASRVEFPDVTMFPDDSST